MPWWLDTGWSTRWSPEETGTRTAILSLALCIFLPIYAAVALLFNGLGVERDVGALIGFFSVGSGALYGGRRICAHLWPDLVKAADENAAKRLALQN
jgi:hypothetical protein